MPMPTSLPDRDIEIALVAAAPIDAEALSSMAARIWPEAYGAILAREQIDHMLGWMYDPRRLRREMLDEGIVYLWIAHGGEKIGFVAYGPVLPGSACPLRKCYLLAETQGRGLGSRALALLVARLAVEKAASIELRVNRRNAAAIAFYRKNGFAIHAEDCREIGAGFVMDDYLMRRDLA